MDERALIRNILNGDQEAFAQLVHAYEKPVYNLCLRMCGNREDARDLTQEAFVKAWRGLPFFQQESSFSTWLYRLTGNVCIDHLRREKRRPSCSLTVGQETDEAVELEPPDPQPLPEEQILHQEQRQAVAWAMMQLEEEFRQVLTLRAVQELPYEEIARIMGLKVGTVKSRLARARQKLKKILLESGNKLENSSSKPVDRRRGYDL